MTVHTVLRGILAAALVAAALVLSAPEAHACGSWEEKQEKILALDAEGRRALVLETTTTFGYDGTVAHHRLFVVDLRAPRADGSTLVAASAAIELRLSARERRMSADALAARIVRRHTARFPIRASV